jgi:trans-aconitate methyltransferase
MDIKEASLLRGNVQNHWYYRSKAKAVEQLLRGISPTTLMDVGAGSGFFSRVLLANSSAVEAWCIDSNYEADTDIVENGKNIHFRSSVGSIDADLVLLMDVLEHVDDDVGLLREYVEKVSANATFLISVPAFQFMWSGHDIFLEHKRRYTLARLESVVAAAGLRVQQSKYFYAAVFPLAMLIRLPNRFFGSKGRPASDMKSHSRFVNALLYGLCRIELALVRRNRWFGLTVFCVAKRA